MEPQLVDQPRGEVLIDGHCAAGDCDVRISCGRSCLIERRLDPVRDERERRAALQLQRFAWMMGQHEHRRVVRRLVAPPAFPLLVPGATTGPEHVPAHHVRVRRRQPVELRRVFLRLLEHPAVQPALDPFAERVLEALVRPGRIAVDGDRDVGSDHPQTAP